MTDSHQNQNSPNDDSRYLNNYVFGQKYRTFLNGMEKENEKLLTSQYYHWNRNVIELLATFLVDLFNGLEPRNII